MDADVIGLVHEFGNHNALDCATIDDNMSGIAFGIFVIHTNYVND